MRFSDFFQHQLLKRLSFHHCVLLAPLSINISPYTCGFISGLSILFDWFTYLYFCQYHAVLITVILQYNLNSGSVILPASSHFSQDCFGYQRPFVFPHATTWVNLENITLNEMLDRKIQEPYFFTHMLNINLKATNEQTRSTNENSQMSKGRGWGSKG